MKKTQKLKKKHVEKQVSNTPTIVLAICALVTTIVAGYALGDVLFALISSF
jgi:hypothetical protein